MPEVREHIPTSDSDKARPRRRRLRWVWIPLASVFGLLLLLILALAITLTPARLTPLAGSLAGKFLDADVRFDSVQVSLFRNFPFVTLRAVNGEVVSHALRSLPGSLRGELPPQADTLLRFADFSASVNLPRLLASRVVIRRLELNRPQVYACVAPDGRANWEIFPAADTTDNEEGMDMGLFLRHLRISDGHIVYNSYPDNFCAEATLDSLTLRGRRGGRYRIGLASAVALRLDTVACNDIPVVMEGGFRYDLADVGRVFLDSLTLHAAGLPMQLHGEALFSADSIYSDLNCRMNPWKLQQVLNLVPEQLMPGLDKFATDITADFDATVRGAYHFESGVLPAVTLECRVDGGYLRHRDMKAQLDRLRLDASLRYDPRRPDSTGVEVRKLQVNGTGIDLSGTLSAWDVLRDARVHARLEGSFQLDTLVKLFPLPQGMIARGRVGISLNGEARRSRLTLQKIGQNRINCRLDLDNFRLVLPEDSIFMMVRGGRIRFGVNENRRGDSTVIPRGEQVVYLSMRADTMFANYKHRVRVVAGGAHVSMRNAASAFGGDTTVVHSFAGSAETRFLQLQMPDSIWVRAEEATTAFRVTPSPDDPAVPVLNLNVGAIGLTVRDAVNYFQLNGTDVSLEATLANANRAGQQQRREQLLDSLQRVYPGTPRDSLFAHLRARRVRVPAQDDFAEADVDIKVDDRIGSLLRRWNAKGSVYAIHGQAATPLFPLPTSLRNVDIDFTTDEINLRDTRIKAGSSGMKLTGRIGNLRRALLGRGNLRVEMHMACDTLNLNELLQGINAGLAYADTDQAYKDSLKTVAEHELHQVLAETAAAQNEEQTTLLVVPRNVEMDVDLDVKYGVYADIVLRSLTGGMIMRDRAIHLNGLKAVSDVGEMELTALYATHSRTDIRAGFDLEMRRVQVERLIAVMPAVDTLLPMLRSFEGVLDCELAATASLDTAMNFLLPTLNGVCRIHGDNMVLLDGETFTEISKMLRFKNKKRNMIDHISAEMIIRDNQIEIFPFVLEMDRYRAAVSGIQHLDLSFDYHISVLRSPLPFRLGVDIYGNPDKFRFRLGRARYKSADVPSYVELIDSTRLNLRDALSEVLRRGVDVASRADMRIAPPVTLPSEITGAYEALTPQDSLLLLNEGILPEDTALSIDPSLEGPAVEEELSGGLTRDERRAARRARRELLRNAEATETEPAGGPTAE